MPATGSFIFVVRKARKVREKSKEKVRRSGGEGGKEYDSFAVLMYEEKHWRTREEKRSWSVTKTVTFPRRLEPLRGC
jgi:hypothetical protein